MKKLASIIIPAIYVFVVLAVLFQITIVVLDFLGLVNAVSTLLN